jgi:hypothetical protein
MHLSLSVRSSAISARACRTVVGVSLSFAAASLQAQTERAQTPSALSGYESRAQLITSATAAESQGRSGEARLLRARLQRGDFQEGDRIVIALDTNSSIVDTLQVRAGKILQIKGISDFSVAGILRSELSDSLRQHLSKYLKNPGVRATPLLPIAIMGEVGAPGYYYTPADVVLRDLLMRAGGPGGDADLSKIVIKRSGETIWNVQTVRIALSSGLSIDQLHMQAGDEIVVPKRRGSGVTSVATIISGTVALIYAIAQLAR